MIKCFQCRKEIENELDMVLVSIDGDFVCGGCHFVYKKDKDRFFNETVHDEQKFLSWREE